MTEQAQNTTEFNMIIRQLDRLEERTRNIVTRSDLETLRKELVARDALEPQLAAIKAQIIRVDLDRIKDKEIIDKQLEAMKTEQMSKQDRLWMRLGQVAGFIALALILFEFLIHFKYFP